MHESTLEQSHGANLDATWQEPDSNTNISKRMETYQVAEQDGAEHVSRLDNYAQKQFFTHFKDMHGAHNSSKHIKTQDKLDEKEDKAVAG